MSKTIRMHQVQEAAGQTFGTKLVELGRKVDLLMKRVGVLENTTNAVPIEKAEIIEGGSILTSGDKK